MKLSSALLSLCFLFFAEALWAQKAPENTPEQSFLQDQNQEVAADLRTQAAYQVIFAEIALQRQEPILASRLYTDLALKSGDLKVLARAAEIAIFAKQHGLASEILQRWQKEAPDSNRAIQLYVSLLVADNKYGELAQPIRRLLEMHPEKLAENLLTANAIFARSTDKSAAYRVISEVTSFYPKIPEAHYAQSVAALGANATEHARRAAQQALHLRPNWEAPALLLAQLIATENPSEAIDFMNDFLRKTPQAQEIQLQLARVLVLEKRFTEALPLFNTLQKTYPDSADVLFPLAFMLLQQNEMARAEALFLKITTLPNANVSVAWFYLGQIAEETKRFDEALVHYQKVNDSKNVSVANVRSAQILARQGKTAEARLLLQTIQTENEAEKISLAISEASILREAKQTKDAFHLLDNLLKKHPENPELLYESALLAEQLKQFAVTETRLRKLIVLNPEDAQAYNALGYSFVERGTHLKEAKELIEKALSISPKDAAILDSMGWALYKLGEKGDALAYLQEAYLAREDIEIALHLIEVLVSLGRKNEAIIYLNKFDIEHPNNAEIAKTRKNLFP